MNHNLDRLSPTACKAARLLLKLDQRELASLAGISTSTLGRFERGDADVGDYARMRIREALTKEGIVFVTGTEPRLR